MIAIGSDHGGIEYKEKIKEFLEKCEIEVNDVGTHTKDSVDYPDIAKKAIGEIKSGVCQKAILICKTGTGMSICANRDKDIRAAACESIEVATLARKHNDINVLCLGQSIVSWEVAEEIIKVFLKTPFEGERHLVRLSKI